MPTLCDGLLGTAYLVVIVVACYFHPVKGTMERGEVHLIKFTSGFVSTFPVQVFAFTCAQNVSFSAERQIRLLTAPASAVSDFQRDPEEHAEENEHRDRNFHRLCGVHL